MQNLPLTVACGPYDRTEALWNGAVQPEGIDLRYLAIQSPPEIFARMIHQKSFDLSEMSVSHYMISRAKGDFPFVALPIFPSRVFRHGFIFVNTDAGIRTPKDLEGRRVGVPEYRQTAALWIRGILQHEYGVALERITWMEGGVNTPRQPDVVMDLRPETKLDLQYIPEGRTLNDMLAKDEIDAMIGARQPFNLGKHPKVARLFPNYREVEADYYRKTGIFPIMHTLVMQEPVYRANPWIAESLFKAFEESKHWAIQQMRFSGAIRYTLPWLFADLEEIDGLFGGDPWPYGLEANRKTLEMMTQFLVDQGFLRERPRIDDLFAPIVLSNE